nr:MAG TPA: hypothetical protein [Caudoviricetes sp.]
MTFNNLISKLLMKLLFSTPGKTGFGLQQINAYKKTI